MRNLGKKFVAAFVCLLAVVMLGAGQNDAGSRYNRIGHKMMCVCGCNQVLLECNHVGCPDSAGMIGELRDQVTPPGTGGTSAVAATNDTTILNWFVAKYGATVLAAPIRGGFDTVAWIVPMALLILAIFGTAFTVKMWSARRRPALATATQTWVSPDLRERIRRETEY